MSNIFGSKFLLNKTGKIQVLFIGSRKFYNMNSIELHEI